MSCERGHKGLSGYWDTKMTTAPRESSSLSGRHPLGGEELIGFAVKMPIQKTGKAWEKCMMENDIPILVFEIER